MTRFLVLMSSVRRSLDSVRLGWLHARRALAGREALSRFHRRFFVPRLEMLEERIVLASTQEALTPAALMSGAALLRDDMAATIRLVNEGGVNMTSVQAAFGKLL